DGTTVYGSILMQKVGVGGTGSDAVEVRLITPVNNEGFRVGFASNEGFFIDSGVQQLNMGAGTLDIGQNYFFVFKAVSSADGPDQFFASAYGPSDPVPSTEPITWDLMLEEAVSHNFNGIRLDAGPNTEGALFDEI